MATPNEKKKHHSPEIFFGSSGNTYLGNGYSYTMGRQILMEPSEINKEILYLVGEWNFTNEFAENVVVPAEIIFRYEGKNVYLFAGADQPVEIGVFLDNKELNGAAGRDSKFHNGVYATTVQDERLYHLINDSKGRGEHIIKIIINGPKIKVFRLIFT